MTYQKDLHLFVILKSEDFYLGLLRKTFLAQLIYQVKE